MALTHRVATADSSNTTSYISGAFVPALNDLLVAFVIASATTTGGGAVFAMTDSQSLGFTLVTTSVKASSADTLCVFVANKLAANSSMTVTFTCVGDASTSVVISVESIPGCSITGLGAIRQSAIQSNGAAAGTPAPAFPIAALTGSACLGAVGNASTPATVTPTASWGELVDTSVATPTAGLETQGIDTGFTGTTVTWGSTSATAFCALVVEVDKRLGNLRGVGDMEDISKTRQTAAKRASCF